MTKTIWNLLKALLNATLLLLALCLFLGWQLFASARGVSEDLGKISARFTPIHDQLQTINTEVADLNRSLTESDSPDSAEMRFRLARLEEQLSRINEETDTMSALPAQVVTTAVEAAVQSITAEMSTRLPRLQNCTTQAATLLN